MPTNRMTISTATSAAVASSSAEPTIRSRRAMMPSSGAVAAMAGWLTDISARRRGGCGLGEDRRRGHRVVDDRGILRQQEAFGLRLSRRDADAVDVVVLVLVA